VRFANEPTSLEFHSGIVARSLQISAFCRPDKLYFPLFPIPAHKRVAAWWMFRHAALMRDGGYSKCDEATRQFAAKNSPDEIRLREVGKAFRNERD
jgi:hypothetical protein